MPDQPFPEGMLEDIEKFFALECTREPGKDLYPSVFETALFFPLQRQAELAEMMREARRVKPRVVMEIGTDKGGGLYHWCKCLPTVEDVIACEIRGLPYAELFEKNFPRIRFTWMPFSSRKYTTPSAIVGSINAIQNKECDPIDCLFIDGDKSSFVSDFLAYSPLMSPSGIVFMHDIKDSGTPMRDAFEWCKKQGYRTREIIDVSDTHKTLRLAERGLPPANPHEGWLRHWKGTSCGVGVIYMPEHLGPEGK
jgi:hypothetical protein